ncbi:Inner membrane protein YohK [Marinomonas spartinae]|uniref:Inner membrane protein YohK n=1 Tax=Marinomonas spartinae TaxID=1792290 RepID=A0A1A8T430_9GAMM|nr:LrgB family protein [Marinomonas spartinae]SBS25849.1 Inner membrane protein YohK [Marinomonas spartinae]
MSDTLLACLSFVATIGFYYLTKWAYRRKKIFFLAPILLAPLAIIGFVLLVGIPLDDYFLYTHFLVMMLGPATIAFAVPIYQQRSIIKRYPLTLTIGVITGLMMGMLSSWVLVHIFPMPPELANSMLSRSVSTPFAMQATVSFGGIPDLTAMLVLMTGIVGMVICEPVFRYIGIRTTLAKGIALGAASHGAGTAKAREIGSEEGVIASLTMIFAGIAMVIGSPLFALII